MLLSGCGRSIDPPGKSGELVVVTRYGPNTYYLDKEGKPAGFEYELVSRFADAHGWKLRLEVADTMEEMKAALEDRRVHLAAGWLAVTPERQRRFRYGPSYAEEKEWMVCRAGIPRPAGLAELSKLRVEVVAGSSHEETLKRLRKMNAGLRWAVMDSTTEEDLLDRVSSGLTDCAVADGVAFNLAKAYMTGLVKAFDIGQTQLIAWAMPWRADKGLREQLQRFFKKITAAGDLELLRARYLGLRDPMQEVDMQLFMERRADRLHGLRGMFREAQLETGLDWRLLAAIAYQESQWDPRAVSPTGVRGIMMLTVDTADRLGVKNRLDPRESILGGARYVVILRDSIPSEIVEPDRTWLALAAYNIGLGHLQDAQRLAQSLDKNPNAWADMREILPLISRGRYASKLKYGYARGGEARRFVENVRLFYDMMRRLESPYVFDFVDIKGTGGETVVAP